MLCCRGVQERNRALLEASGNTEAEPSWMDDYPAESTAIQIYHAVVLRNKRLLLAYQYVFQAAPPDRRVILGNPSGLLHASCSSARMGLIRTLRWRHRNLPDILKQNLSTAEQAVGTSAGCKESASATVNFACLIS